MTSIYPSWFRQQTVILAAPPPPPPPNCSLCKIPTGHQSDTCWTGVEFCDPPFTMFCLKGVSRQSSSEPGHLSSDPCITECTGTMEAEKGLRPIHTCSNKNIHNFSDPCHEQPWTVQCLNMPILWTIPAWFFWPLPWTTLNSAMSEHAHFMDNTSMKNVQQESMDGLCGCQATLNIEHTHTQRLTHLHQVHVGYQALNSLDQLDFLGSIKLGQFDREDHLLLAGSNFLLLFLLHKPYPTHLTDSSVSQDLQHSHMSPLTWYPRAKTFHKIKKIS